MCSACIVSANGNPEGYRCQSFSSSVSQQPNTLTSGGGCLIVMCDRWNQDIIEYASDWEPVCAGVLPKREDTIRACSDSGKLHFFLFSFPQNSKDNWSHAVPSCPCVSCLIKSTKQRCHQWVSGQIVCTLNLVYCESRCHVHYFIHCLLGYTKYSFNWWDCEW